MRWGDNDDEIGIFVKGTRYNIGIGGTAMFIDYLYPKRKRSVVVYVMSNR